MNFLSLSSSFSFCWQMIDVWLDGVSFLFPFLLETDFCVQRRFLLYFLMSKIILLVNFGIITGPKICWISNSYKAWLGEGDPINIFNKLFRAVLNNCRKFEDIIFDIFEDMTFYSRCIIFRTPGIINGLCSNELEILLRKLSN